MDMATINFGKWLETKFLEWQRQEGGRRTAGEFSEWLGFGNTTANQWLNGRHVPARGNAQALALKLGLEVYDVLGLSRPDEALYQVNVSWHILKDDEKAAVGKVIQRATQKRLGFVPDHFVERRDPNRTDPSIGRRATDKVNGND
jgi:hypothetical protein